MSIDGSNVDPRLATLVVRSDRDLDRLQQLVGLQNYQIGSVSRLPSDALVDKLIGPDMQIKQRFQTLSIVDAQGIRNLGPCSERNGVVGDRGVWVDEVMKIRFEQSIRFVKMSGVEQETTVGHLEMAIGLPDATLAQQEELVARGERVDRGRPLFEGDV